MFPCRDDPHWIKTQNMEKKRKENYTKSQKNEVIQFSQLNFFFFFNIFPLQFYHRDQNPVIQSLAGNSAFRSY